MKNNLLDKILSEHTKILNKTNKLENFILFDSKFKEIDEKHQGLLELQLLAMKMYKKCLSQRIELLLGEGEDE